ncbi:hypothetical protein WA158_001837 [Blastocystis sp. Blastoise]
MSSPISNDDLQIYRYSTIGKSLITTLDELKEKKKLSEEQCQLILYKFDHVVMNYFKKNKDILPHGEINGQVENYNLYDDYWKYELNSSTISIDDECILDTNEIKIVSCPEQKQT